MKKSIATGVAAAMTVAASLVSTTAMVQAQDQAKPNILMIWGDDIGQFNVSAYNNGMMGYRTPNIDRIADGRRALHRLVRPAELHRRARRLHHRPVADPHRPDQGRPAGRARGHEGRGSDHRRALTPLGYATGQFGKNHLGDRDEMLPTNNGFDQFLGNLYHLNAEEEPENPDYPKSPAFKEQFGPRGVIRSQAMPDGTPADRGHRSADEEAHGDGGRGGHRRSARFMDKAHADGKPFFVWWNSTRMHIFTHLKPESDGKTGQGSTPTACSSTTAWSVSSLPSSTSSGSPTTRS